MELILLFLFAIGAAVFAARLFLLRRAIERLRRDFCEVTAQKDADRHLTLDYQDKALEELAAELNRYIEDCYTERYRHRCREKNIRSEITNISHDLRTPLTSITGYLGLIQGENLTDREKKEYFGVINRRSQDLEDMIQCLYDYARLENEEYRFHMEKTDIRHLFCEYLLSFYSEFQQKKIQVQVELLKEPVMVTADREALNRIFYNLITNLMKYSGKSCRIAMQSCGDTIQILFENPAPEMSDYEAQHLFDRFYRAERTKTAQGSGLGLTIAKMLTEGMGGTLTARCRDGRLILCFSMKTIAFSYDGP
ncbi:MAG TPA: HAMP domain-containing histidine kinase [Candidatus Limivivens intestinipullorum]|uniref:histidine kinase n=1 Tax=Candidatus Limivivens intestinipullorum TaxID=2840858 RepID=A0A9D1ERQ1_9FIRM|nr:HAMP domain-containing histidine kinase [Candidatus Limivivens intestinipullorum]